MIYHDWVMTHEVLDRSDLKEGLAAQRHALIAAANGDTSAALVHLCALGAALIAFASRVSERLAKLERGAGLLLALVAATALQGCAVDVEAELPPVGAVESDMFSVPNESPAMERYASELTVAIDTWAATYDISDDCDPYALRIAPAGDRLFARVCGKGDLLGCTAIIDRRNAVMLIRPTADKANTVTHEAMHWLAFCSGAFADAQSDHDDPLIWGKGGILARTNDALGLPHD